MQSFYIDVVFVVLIVIAVIKLYVRMLFTTSSNVIFILIGSLTKKDTTLFSFTDITQDLTLPFFCLMV